jgi:hypothetical protein
MPRPALDSSIVSIPENLKQFRDCLSKHIAKINHPFAIVGISFACISTKSVSS